MKYRGIGQGSTDEVATRDLKQELMEKEQRHQDNVDASLRRKGLMEEPPDINMNKGPQVIPSLTDADLAQFGDSDDSDSSSEETSEEEEEDEEQQLREELAKIKREREEERKRQQEKERKNWPKLNEKGKKKGRS